MGAGGWRKTGKIVHSFRACPALARLRRAKLKGALGVCPPRRASRFSATPLRAPSPAKREGTASVHTRKNAGLGVLQFEFESDVRLN